MFSCVASPPGKFRFIEGYRGGYLPIMLFFTYFFSIHNLVLGVMYS